MKTVTLSIDDEIFQAAEAEAARRQSTVGEVVQQALRTMVGGKTPDPAAEQTEREHRLRLVDMLEQCQIDLTERPTREATYAHRRFH